MDYLGIEIGGTKLQAALGDGRGTIVRTERLTAEPEAGRPRICAQIIELVHRFDSRIGSIAGVGIGFGGPVDTRGGRVLKSHQVAGWDDFPLTSWLERETGLRCVLDNDSDLAGLAEACFGAGRGFSPVVYMNIGSGIGGSLVIDRRSYVGQGLGSLEIGHLRIDAEAGYRRQTLESLCSGWALADQARRAADSDPNSLLAQLMAKESDHHSTRPLFEAVRAGDAAATRLWSRCIDRLGAAVANVITLLAPQRFVLGGGVALVGDLLFEPLRAAVAEQVFAPFAGTYEIVPAALGELVVLHGALTIAHDRLGLGE